jgi:hypothetical protein
LYSRILCAGRVFGSLNAQVQMYYSSMQDKL